MPIALLRLGDQHLQLLRHHLQHDPGLLYFGRAVKFTSVIGGALVAAASVMVYVYNNRSNKKAGDETTK